MSKKSKWIIASVVIVVVAIFLITTVFQRQYRNVLMEMIIFPEGGCGDNAPVYRFIVQNNGRFISYTGISFNHCNVARSDIIMWPIIRRRSRITLSDEDFKNISRMVSSVLSEFYGEERMRTNSMWQATLLHGGNMYSNSGLEFHRLTDEIIRLSPLMTRYHDPRISPN